MYLNLTSIQNCQAKELSLCQPSDEFKAARFTHRHHRRVLCSVLYRVSATSIYSPELYRRAARTDRHPECKGDISAPLYSKRYNLGTVYLARKNHTPTRGWLRKSPTDISPLSRDSKDEEQRILCTTDTTKNGSQKPRQRRAQSGRPHRSHRGRGPQQLLTSQVAKLWRRSLFHGSITFVAPAAILCRLLPPAN